MMIVMVEKYRRLHHVVYSKDSSTWLCLPWINFQPLHALLPKLNSLFLPGMSTRSCQSRVKDLTAPRRCFEGEGAEGVKHIVSAPEEFRVIARHVLGIIGSMLPDDTNKHTMSFWQDDGVWDHLKIPTRIKRLESLEYPWDIGEKVALLWGPVMVLEGEFSCFYIQEPDGTWSWKFGWRWQGDEQISDNIPELFEWYLSTLESEPPGLVGLTAEAVMNRLLNT